MDKTLTLHPKIRTEVANLVNYINTNILTGSAKVKISQGLRTFAEQDALYLQRPRVTKAKGGDSIHNYGLAVDIVLIIDGKVAVWDTKKDFDKDLQADWMEVTNYFKSKGWKWGGDFKSLYDAPHFEMTFGHSPKTLKALIDKKNVIIDNGITYPNI